MASGWGARSHKRGPVASSMVPMARPSLTACASTRLVVSQCARLLKDSAEMEVPRAAAVLSAVKSCIASWSRPIEAGDEVAAAEARCSARVADIMVWWDKNLVVLWTLTSSKVLSCNNYFNSELLYDRDTKLMF